MSKVPSRYTENTVLAAGMSMSTIEGAWQRAHGLMFATPTSKASGGINTGCGQQTSLLTLKLAGRDQLISGHDKSPNRRLFHEAPQRGRADFSSSSYGGGKQRACIDCVTFSAKILKLCSLFITISIYALFMINILECALQASRGKNRRYGLFSLVRTLPNAGDMHLLLLIAVAWYNFPT